MLPKVVLLSLAALLAGFILGERASAERDPRKMLMQLDRDFDLATAEKGVEGWVSFFAEDGMMMPGGADTIIGKAAIRERMAQSLGTPGFSLRWEPVEADVSGDLGYTYGVGKATRPGADGKPQVSYSRYVTIWKKQRDRSWKIVLDIGNPIPQPQSSR